MLSLNSKELLTLQKLVVEDSPNRLMFSEKELIKMAHFNAEGYLKIVYDSIELVNHTANPDVFFLRFELLEENLYTLSLFEPYIEFKNEKPSDRLHTIQSMKQDAIHDFLTRYFGDAKKQADKLKTDKGKLNKYERFYQNLQQYYELMESENIEYAETSYKSAIDAIKKAKDLKSSSSEQQSETQSTQSTEIVESKRATPTIKPSSISSDWNISISFGRSSSQNFDKALFLAKQAPKYDEQEYNGKTIYQATYGKDEEQYLAFIQLYEMIKTWKSTAVFINGKLIDRKIIGGLNYCYGDKCRSGDPDFCYGASFMTKNPFGCHRLQVSASNHPWWSFSEKSGDYYYINKDEIRQRIDSYAKNYKLCPCFDEAKIYEALDDLPTRITTDKYNELLRGSSLVYSVSVNMGSQSSSQNSPAIQNFQSGSVLSAPKNSSSVNLPPTTNHTSQNVKRQTQQITTTGGGCILPVMTAIAVIVGIIIAII
jgi:hypothetical protein